MFPLQLTNFALIHFQLVSCNISIKNVCVCVRETDRQRETKKEKARDRETISMYVCVKSAIIYNEQHDIDVVVGYLVCLSMTLN